MGAPSLVDRALARVLGYSVAGPGKLRALVNALACSLGLPRACWDWGGWPLPVDGRPLVAPDGLVARGLGGDAPMVLGMHERFTLEFLELVLAEGSVFIDVGAHVGCFTMRAARIVGPRGLVVALEPDPRAFAALVWNVRANRLRNVLALPWAAGSEAGEAVLKIAEVSGHSSLLQPLSRVVGEVRVRVVTLDWLSERLGRVNALKVDVEGAEEDVLRGAGGLLERLGPPLIVEVHGFERLKGVVRELEERGYEWWLVNAVPSKVWHLHVAASRPGSPAHERVSRWASRREERVFESCRACLEALEGG